MDIDVESPSRSSGRSSSPEKEFEFWMVGNHPELEPNHNLLSADQLIVDGVLLPLHLLSISNSSNSQPNIIIQQDSKSQEPEVEAPTPITTLLDSSSSSSSSIYSSTPCSISSKRWKDIFKVGERKKEPANANDNDKQRKKDRKGSNNAAANSTTANNGNTNGSAELNINIWPFSRSRSAGTATSGRPKLSAAIRKSSSAPCSRSNSRGESSAAGRRWVSSPGRPGVGVHVGRASPVWQVKRPGPARVGPNREKVRKGGMGGGGVKGLNLNLSLNVNSCIGYGGAQGRCRGEDSDGGPTGAERNGDAGGGGANGSLFRFRALFSKKVY